MASLRRLILLQLLLAAAALLMGCRDDEANGWNEVTSSEGRFSVSLPGEATYSSEAVEAPSSKSTVHHWRAETESGKTAYSVSYNDLPGLPLEGKAAKEFLASQIPPDFNLVNERAVSVGRDPGREIEARAMLDGTPLFMTARFFLVKNRFYQLVIIREGGPVDENSRTKMFDSFGLLPEE